MNETKTIRMASVRPVGEHAWRIRWVNGTAYVVDLRRLVFGLKGLRPLRDPWVFAKAIAGEGGRSVTWPGDLDMGPAPAGMTTLK